MGPLLVSHRALASSGSQVQPAGGRGVEVPNAAGRPRHGGGESGPYSASGKAGVCMQFSVKATLTHISCYVSEATLQLRFNQIKRLTCFQ